MNAIKRVILGLFGLLNGGSPVPVYAEQDVNRLDRTQRPA